MSLYSFTYYLKPWLLPPGINIFLMAIGFLISLCSRKIGRIICAIGFLSLWLLSTPFVAYQLINVLQDQYPLINPNFLHAPSQPAAIVVLGGGDTIEAEYGNKPTVSNHTFQRLKYAAYLYAKTPLPILVSGGKTYGSSTTIASLMAENLLNTYHIKTSYLEEKSLTTGEESKFILPILKENNIKIIYLITNAWHMPRSMLAFKRFSSLGVEVIPAPMGYINYGPGYNLLSFFPNKEALNTSAIALHEFIGLIKYRLFL